jgi:hypothetical protein
MMTLTCTRTQATPVGSAGPSATEPLIKQVSRFVQGVVDIVAGDRPCSQVMGMADASVYDLLTTRAVAAHRVRSRAAARRLRPRVVSVRVVCHRPGVAEVSARVCHGERSRALAARLEHTRGRWVCTALDIG